MSPDVDDLVVAFGIGDEAHRVVVHDFLDLTVAFGHDFFFFGGDDHVAEVEREAALECHAVAKVLDVVEELCGARDAAFLDDACDDVAQRFLREDLVDKSDFVGHVAVDEHASDRGLFDDVADRIAVVVDIVYHHADGSVESDFAFVIGDFGFFGAVEHGAFAFVALAELGDIVEAEHHVL